MPYTLQAFKTDTLASSLTSVATSMTLSSGSFGTPTGQQLLVIDYNDATKKEIVLCSIAGATVTSMTRGVDGTTAQAHSAAAPVTMAFVPTHYAQLGALASSDPWSTWTPVYGGYSVSPTPSVARYVQVGKWVTATLEHSAYGTSNATTMTVTLPVAAKSSQTLVAGRIRDNGGYSATIGTLVTTAGSATASVFRDMTGTAWTAANGKGADFTVTYEAN